MGGDCTRFQAAQRLICANLPLAPRAGKRVFRLPDILRAPLFTHLMQSSIFRPFQPFSGCQPSQGNPPCCKTPPLWKNAISNSSKPFAKTSRFSRSNCRSKTNTPSCPPPTKNTRMANPLAWYAFGHPPRAPAIAAAKNEQNTKSPRLAWRNFWKAGA